ncbi:MULTISPECIES: CDP-diacylglycerol--glycerol-3-phosphate 3-phosphatidyltransferase [Streptomyces]|uniref:CDP-diacylglycerol--glycerol-3-phosphate 3-phosphatidyltransferase n=1 Tax=Streptomyces chartreusis NRRL 3882 TaxID=1079985 RepID=A0A2N9B5M2_STRCX|nr:MULTISPECIES: CDP-diacylglycerol--glycerol-3-phosphate 3-phosphatidyltransferase [Streptomyces]MYS89831.1 CDP-diacylglycerol--glycerol-3-phosphate 3-phosphatidyltransferase [Streptomyces sp. SID5464]SOR78646.1 putative CDP-diacylglycerol-glycerol-3-phosphate 3-phosphatidyl-transferase 2 [Streptomyces chartreusis NRRL 3882]
MTGVPASAAGGPSGARRAAAGAASGKVPGASMGRSAARSTEGGASGAAPGARQGAASGVGDSGAAAGDGAESAVVDAQDDGKPARGGKLAAAAVNQASVWNVANLLTMLRLILVPAFVALMLADGGYDPAWRALAWAAFAIAMITDLFDGHLARTYNLVTDFGKIADPIADKAIMGAALICLSALGDLPWWVTGVILGRELGITLLRFLVIRYGVIPASRGGKLKTLTQGVAVGMYVLALTGWLATLRFWVMAAAVVLTVVTGLDYVKQAIVLRRRGIAERKAALEEKEA